MINKSVTNIHYETFSISTSKPWHINRWNCRYLYLLSDRTTSLSFGAYGNIVLLPNRLTFIPYPEGLQVSSPLNINPIYLTAIVSNEIFNSPDVNTSTMFFAEGAQQGWSATVQLTPAANNYAAIQISPLGFNNSKNVPTAKIVLTRAHVSAATSTIFNQINLVTVTGVDAADANLTTPITPVNHLVDAPALFPAYSQIQAGAPAFIVGSGVINFTTFITGDLLNGSTRIITKNAAATIGIYASPTTASPIFINIDWYEEF